MGFEFDESEMYPCDICGEFWPMGEMHELEDGRIVYRNSKKILILTNKTLSALPIRLLRGIQIVAATLLVVATAIAFYIHRDVVFVHVGREAVWASAVRAAESAVLVLILQQVVTVVLLHIVSRCHTMSTNSPSM